MKIRLMKGAILATLSLTNCLAGVISYSGVMATYVVPTTATYYVLAAGAAGGSGASGNGGNGAEIEGFAVLAAGTQLDIVVGGAGLTGNFGSSWAGGGGGGTFVWIDGSSTPLIVAAGGGGASYDGPGGVAPTSYTTAGDSGLGLSGGAGGCNGSGGAGGSGNEGQDDGGGGAGWFSAGGDGAGTGPFSGTAGSGNGGFGAFTFIGGFGGGDDPINGPFANGGFGGGGGGGWQGGGGGGGYSGGGGGDGSGFAGGAGGSYLDNSLSFAGFLNVGTTGDGFADIETSQISLGETPGDTPEPGTIALLALGLGGLRIARGRII